MVGETEESLQQKGVEFVIGRGPYHASPRGRIIGDADGFLNLLFRCGDMQLLGTHVIGEQATELVHLGMVGMMAGIHRGQVRDGVLQYPHPRGSIQDCCARRPVAGARLPTAGGNRSRRITGRCGGPPYMAVGRCVARSRSNPRQERLAERRFLIQAVGVTVRRARAAFRAAALSAWRCKLAKVCAAVA